MLHWLFFFFNPISRHLPIGSGTATGVKMLGKSFLEMSYLSSVDLGVFCVRSLMYIAGCTFKGWGWVQCLGFVGAWTEFPGVQASICQESHPLLMKLYCKVHTNSRDVTLWRSASEPVPTAYFCVPGHMVGLPWGEDRHTLNWRDLNFGGQLASCIPGKNFYRSS